MLNNLLQKLFKPRVQTSQIIYAEGDYKRERTYAEGYCYDKSCSVIEICKPKEGEQ